MREGESRKLVPGNYQTSMIIFRIITGFFMIPVVMKAVAADVPGCRVLLVLRSAAIAELAQPVFTRGSDLVHPCHINRTDFIRGIRRKKYRNPVKSA
jgi:hypothetical protein